MKMIKKKTISYSQWGWPLFMSFIRLPLILLGNIAIVLAYQAADQSVGSGVAATFSTLSVTLINVICLALLLWRARVENFQLREMIGFQRNRLLRDLGSGMLWSFVLFAILMSGLLAAVFVTQRVTGQSFEAIYLGNIDFSQIEMPVWLTAVYAIIAAFLFPVFNAPVEELIYRGYAQPRLITASSSVWLGIGIPAFGFGLQHIAFAYTLASMPAFVVGFLLWGLGAGLIAYRQQRLMPIIAAHFVSNLSFGLVPLIFMLRGA